MRRPGEPEIEITPAMIQAGLERLDRFHDAPSPERLVMEVYRAMAAARTRVGPKHSKRVTRRSGPKREIEITSEMIDAALDALMEWRGEEDVLLVREIVRAGLRRLPVGTGLR